MAANENTNYDIDRKSGFIFLYQKKNPSLYIIYFTLVIGFTPTYSIESVSITTKVLSSIPVYWPDVLDTTLTVTSVDF